MLSTRPAPSHSDARLYRFPRKRITIVDPTMRHERDARARSLVTTKAGITIGIRAIPPSAPMNREAERIQAALLAPKPPRTLTARLVRALVNWL